MLPFILAAAVAAAAAAEQQERQRDDRRRRSLTLPVSKGTLLAGGLAMARNVGVEGEGPVVVEIDGGRFVVDNIDTEVYRDLVDGHGKIVTDDGTPNGIPTKVLCATLLVRELEDGDDPDDPSGEEREYIVFEDSQQAGLVARNNSWNNIIGDPDNIDEKNVVAILGSENLIRWALGLPAGPGTTKVRSLAEWFDLSLNAPEEELAGYDNQEASIDKDQEEEGLEALEEMGIDSWTRLCSALGFVPSVAYRNQ